jgi:hypothetical protein
MTSGPTDTYDPRIYDEEGSLLLNAEEMADRIVLLPSTGERPKAVSRDRIRIMWGHDLASDLLSFKYRSFVCAVNAEDVSHSIITQIAEHLTGSQWNRDRIVGHAKMFSQSISKGEQLVIKYDMEAFEVLALLRPPGRQYFTLADLKHGFEVVASMLEGRRERLPSASVSFLEAKSNRVVDEDGNAPSFETVLRIMYEAGYRGDVYPSPGMWHIAPTGVFSSYPFPESLDRMRSGGF